MLVLYGACILLGLFAWLAVFVHGPANAVLLALVAATSYVGIRKLG